MKPTQQLHDLGQSLWLDNITRTMLDDGTEQGYIDEFSVTGQTSNPTIFDKAISSGDAYDEQIAELREKGLDGEELFFELALADVTRAAKIFEGIYRETDRMDGWVSLEVSPKLAYDTQATIRQAAELHGRAEENNFIKIPGTPEGLPAIEESIFAGVPINVTLLMSTDQTMAAAEAYMKGIERRIESDLAPDVPSVLSLFISRWDVAVHDDVPDELKNMLGVAVGKATYKAWREMLDSDRWQGLADQGAQAAAAALRQHRNQGSRGLGHPLHRGVRSPGHDQHDARQDPQGLRRPRQGRRSAAGRRRRLRGGLQGAPGRRHRHRRARVEAPEGRGGRLRQVLERAARDDQVRVGSPGGVEHAARCNESCRVERPGLRACRAGAIM